MLNCLKFLLLLLFNIIFIYMSRIAGIASGDRRRRSRSLSTSEVEVPSSISIAAPAPSSEGPALADLSETGSSETNLLGIIIPFI